MTKSRLFIAFYFSIIIIPFNTGLLKAEEKESFIDIHSVLTLHENGDISATETIKVRALGKLIKRGIVKKYNTVYPDGAGGTERLKFSILSIKCNGHFEPFHTEETEEGLTITIGEENVFLEPGEYIYEIAYHKENEIINEPDKNILFLYPVGGLQLPAENASLTVKLPDNVNPKIVDAFAFNNIEIEKAEMFPYEYRKDQNEWYFKTNRQLEVGEQFIVVLMWPK